jgi:3-deoxy-manno-octulosonate cytidylyltransferase (CMP-KDO synthetase)
VRIVAVIPARMSASRFPGKPLAPLLEKPMLQHVYSRTAACSLLDAVLIATCDAEIAERAQAFGAKVAMTSTTHQRASDRVAEAIANDPADIVVMVQGDEPMIEPDMIRAAVEPMLTDARIQCVNLAAPIQSEAELLSPNTIKTAISRSGDALYFSRSVIPTLANRTFADSEWFKQVCVIPFRRGALDTFASLPQGPLEIAESIDMLRFLENGIPVRMVRTDIQTHAVDTPADLEWVAALMSGRSGVTG